MKCILKTVFVFVFVLPGLVWTVGCGKDYVTGKSTLNFYSLKSDIKLGTYVMQEQLKAVEKKKIKFDLKANVADYNRLRRIAKRIAAVSHIPNFPYELHMADIGIVNAWCAPGGKIMVYTGLWEGEHSKKGSDAEKSANAKKGMAGLVHKGDDDEIAAVLAHEIAHATARHVTERLSRLSSIMLIGEIAASVIAGAGSPDGSDAFREIFSQGMNIYVPSYSRKSEAEADRIGLFYMAKAGYNPESAVRLWERAALERKDNRTSIYASHPASGERAKKLKVLLSEAMKIYKETLRKHR